MEELFYYIGEFADNWAALFAFVFVASFVNVFFPPVPIEGLVLLGSYFAGLGRGNALVLWLASVSGMWIGSTLLYLLAKSRSGALMDWSLIRRQVSPSQLAKAKQWFERYGFWTLFAGKLVPGLSFVSVLGSGLFGLSQRKALPALLVANMLFFAAITLFGRYVGRDWHVILPLIQRVGRPYLAGLVSLLAILGVGYLLNRRRRQKPE
jgi:membrane protein DedA with SNARE-associated domain